MTRALLAGLALACAVSSASAQQGQACKPIEEVKALAAAHSATWIELTHEQWQFLRGVYAMNPQTPPGLPFGDKAVLARTGEGGAIVFIDGDKACTPMGAPKELLDIVNQVGEGFIGHEGAGL